MASWLRKIAYKVAFLLRYHYNRIVDSELRTIRMTKRLQKKTLRQIKKKKFLKVAFFVNQRSVWKCDLVYNKMIEHDAFEPVIVVCPVVTRGEIYMWEEHTATVQYFLNLKYKVINPYDTTTRGWIDIKKTFDPDIIFFSSPYDLTFQQYSVMNFADRLTTYVPYGIMSANIERLQYDQLFHNLMWRCFYETSIHYEMAKKYARNKGENVIVTGYPACDPFLDYTHLPQDVWKIKDKRVKRIIWAPHHTIESNENIAYSTFLLVNEYMLELSRDLKSEIQIAFKPHPILRAKLYEHPEWGKTKTDNYYDEWRFSDNRMLCEDDYIDLFKTSDGMILDSISFISEYAYTGKPIFFIERNCAIETKFNFFGCLAWQCLYKGSSKKSIFAFIRDVIINQQDPLTDIRREFKRNYLIPPDSNTASDNIIYHILKATRPNEIHF